MSLVERFEHGGVEGLRVGRFTSRINTTCIVYRIGATVIDAGPPNQWRLVRRFLSERQVGRLLITHHHEDHGGNGAAIRREFGARVLTHPAGRPFLAGGFKVHLYRRLVWGKPPLFEPEDMPDELRSEDGVRLRAIHTPGHSKDLACYIEPDRGWLFTGDLFIAAKPRYLRSDEDPAREIESLRVVLTYDFETVYCAHRGVVTDGRAAIQAKLDYLISLRAQIRDLREEGLPIREITRRLLGPEDLLTWVSRGHFSKRNLVEAMARNGPSAERASSSPTASASSE